MDKSKLDALILVAVFLAGVVVVLLVEVSQLRRRLDQAARAGWHNARMAQSALAEAAALRSQRRTGLAGWVAGDGSGQSGTDG